MSRQATATIHLGALTRNLQRMRQHARGSRVMAVIKADGYGHGLERVARALQNADAFGVASIADGQRLRAAGFRHRVVVLSGIDEAGDLLEVRRLSLDVVVHHPQQIDLIEHDRDPRPLRAWLKFDTGMHRLGMPADQLAPQLSRLRALPQVDPEIVLMSHLARSDEPESSATAVQIARFETAAAAPALPRSLCNSAGILLFPEACYDWVRSGGLLYGLSVMAGKTGAELGFEPAMRLSSKLIAIQHVPAGEAVGYGGSVRLDQDTRVGVVAMGYGDGYPRSAPSGTPVLIRGRRAATLGRVSMDLLTIDLNAIADAELGDRVTLWGPELPVEEIASCAGTISYELTCGVTRRVLFAEDRS